MSVAPVETLLVILLLLLAGNVGLIPLAILLVAAFTTVARSG